jgi:hypothetical protein
MKHQYITHEQIFYPPITAINLKDFSKKKAILADCYSTDKLPLL